jgi:hypothetical protein
VQTGIFNNNWFEFTTAMKHECPHVYLWFVALIACIVLPSARSYEFEVTGHLSVDNYLRGSILSRQIYDFQLTVSNELWHLRAVDYNLHAAPAVETTSRAIRAPQPGNLQSNNQRRFTLTLVAGTDGKSVYGFSTVQDAKETPTVQGFVTCGWRLHRPSV